LRDRVVAILLALAAASAPAVAADGVPVVYTVNYPLAYFAERVGGDLVQVHFPTPPGVDPAFWKPGPDVIVDFQGADLILRNGAGYAKWTGMASLPRRTQVDTSRSFADQYLPANLGVVHSHGPSGDHSHSGVAFTTWLDPEQAIAQARAIEQALARLRPEHASAFAAGADALEADLRTLDRELREAFAGLAARPLLASHPVYQYLARRYELDLRALLWEPDVAPGEGDWQELDELLAKRPTSLMLWEAEPTVATREQLERRGVGVIVFDPCANRPREGDFISVQRANAGALNDITRPSVQ